LYGITLACLGVLHLVVPVHENKDNQTLIKKSSRE